MAAVPDTRFYINMLVVIHYRCCSDNLHTDTLQKILINRFDIERAIYNRIIQEVSSLWKSQEIWLCLIVSKIKEPGDWMNGTGTLFVQFHNTITYIFTILGLFFQIQVSRWCTYSTEVWNVAHFIHSTFAALLTLRGWGFQALMVYDYKKFNKADDTLGN